jgi:hypothetical protein
MSTNSEASAMRTAQTIVHELNDGHTAGSAEAKAQASNELRQSFNDLLGPGVSHTAREQVLKDVFKIDPKAEAKIHELLPDFNVVHDKQGVNVDKTLAKLEQQGKLQSGDDVTFAPYEALNLEVANAKGKGTRIPTNDNIYAPGSTVSFPTNDNNTNLTPIGPRSHDNMSLPAAGKDSTFAPYENLRLGLAKVPKD